MSHNHYGEFAALFTAFCWTCTALVFEQASRKIGVMMVNLLRLFFAIFLLGLFLYFYRGLILPVDANAETWFWLSLSGLVGFVIGDQLLFMAFVHVGSRVSMLMMSMVPPITAFISYIFLGEVMSLKSLFGMILIIGGIALVILQRTNNNPEKPKQNRIRFAYSLTGIIMALGGAAGQASGLVISKYGMKDYDPFAACQIRVIAGFTGFSILFSIFRKWNKVVESISNRPAMLFLIIGTIFGPFLGVSFSLISIKHTSTGIASTLMSIVPILIIVPSVLIFKEKLKWKEVLGAFVAIIGIALFFI